MQKVILMSVLLVLSAPVWAVDEQQVQQAVEAAKSAFEKAVAEQGGWVSTSKLLKDAELSVANGDKQKALQLAEQAKREAELSYNQIVEQKSNWSEPDYLSR